MADAQTPRRREPADGHDDVVQKGYDAAQEPEPQGDGDPGPGQARDRADAQGRDPADETPGEGEAQQVS